MSHMIASRYGSVLAIFGVRSLTNQYDATDLFAPTTRIRQDTRKFSLQNFSRCLGVVALLDQDFVAHEVRRGGGEIRDSIRAVGVLAESKRRTHP